MPQITSFQLQKNKKRVNIFLDGDFGFGIDMENFLKLKLKVGKELSENEVKGIVEKAEFQKYLDNLLRFASIRPRSEMEIKGWFKRKKVPESIHQDLLAKLKHFELLGDENFARWWVDQRLEFKFKSKKEIEFELQAKGIGREIIKKVLEDSSIDEIKSAGELLKKNAYKWKRYDKKNASQKSAEYLLRKGFSWEIIKKLFKTLKDS